MDISETIFVSIASYRDPELIPTLKDMLRQAENPERLHISVCQQDELASEIFIEAGFSLVETKQVASHQVSVFSYLQARINVIHVHYFTSRGACWARNLAETQFENEDYFLQIDSHCRFSPSWDREMIAMLHQLQQRSPLPIISAYPPGYKPGEDEEASKKTYVSRLIFREYNKEGLPMFTSTPFTAQEPVRGSYLAGGFIFTTADFVKNVPNDPHIFFAGEEISMAVRAFTHGYDIYHPHKPLLWHFYQRQGHNKVWGDHNNDAKNEGKITQAWWEIDKISKNRVRMVLGLEEGIDDNEAPWSRGNIRTLQQFEYQAGIYLRNRTVLPEVLGKEKINFFAIPPEDEEEWIHRQYANYRKTITLSEKEYQTDAEDAEESVLHVSVYNSTNTLLYKREINADELRSLCEKSSPDKLSLALEFKTLGRFEPSVIRLCPWSPASGWGTVTEKNW